MIMVIMAWEHVMRVAQTSYPSSHILQVLWIICKETQLDSPLFALSLCVNEEKSYFYTIVGKRILTLTQFLTQTSVSTLHYIMLLQIGFLKSFLHTNHCDLH